MALQCGIVGLPNVGKSTIFNALTKSHSAQSANFPFCTIDPNVGIVKVPDERFTKICELVHPKNAVPATVEFVDIAGLVKGASKGEGLGNAFLTHIRQVQAILHVVRCFDDENVIHVSGGVNPKEDLETIELELILSDLEQVDKKLNSIARFVKSGDKNAIHLKEVLEKIKNALDNSRPANSIDINDDELLLLKELSLLTLKPVLFAGNLNEEFIGKPEESRHFQILKELAEQRNTIAVPICGKIEEELCQLESEEEMTYLSEFGLKEPGLNRVIRDVYKLLGYYTFFTAGEVEVRAWNITKGTNAQNAAGEIHTDIQRGFIRAEVTGYDDFVKHGGSKEAQTAGKMRLEGKEYLVQDGDIIYFRFNV
ncbi:MAG: redox-regulated ATPase YchF [Spirochaetia bacterium]|nr:redox-regulated ATPase YchF [Spirochaetia bacterium]